MILHLLELENEDYEYCYLQQFLIALHIDFPGKHFT